MLVLIWQGRRVSQLKCIFIYNTTIFLKLKNQSPIQHHRHVARFFRISVGGRIVPWNFGSEVELNAENYPREFETLRRYSESRVSSFERQTLLLERMKNPLFSLPFTKYDLIGILLDFGAELGDEAAGLALLSRGVFANKLWNRKWTELRSERTLSTERLRETLWFALDLERRGVKLNWDWLVRRVCSSQATTESDKSSTEHENCRSAINDLYTKRASSGHDRKDPLLVALDRFQRIAIELDVYE